MVDKITYNGAHGVSGAADQYADGKAAKIWKIVVGDENSRTENYKNFFIDILKQNNCHRVLDSACGTGVDSTMLLEAGFEVASTDASDKMLKHTYKTRWDNRKDPRYDKWIIDEANWITLYEDVKHFLNDGFDAVFCLGNSFAHLLDNYGDQREQRQALANFEKCIKPGGIFIIDHRNFESITESGSTPHKSIYYTNNLDIKTSVLIVSGVKRMVTLDYSIFAPENANGKEKSIVGDFVMSYYPHQLDDFRGLLREAFGPKAHIETYGDFKELKENDNPTFYIHVVKKPL